jgi:pyruvate formate lyase activating enzyme
LNANEGGVTFSGGEPLMQAPYLAEVLDQLDETLHTVLDTSGYGDENAFRSIVKRVDLVYFDLKIIDPKTHEHFTGKDNATILHNLRMLGDLGVPFVVRVPLVPRVTDTNENLEDIARTVRGLDGLVRVDLLPYNRAAGGKYAAVGMHFSPEYDESGVLNLNAGCFVRSGVEVKIA